MVGGQAWQVGVHGRGVHGGGACVARGVRGGGHAWRGGMRGRRDGHCSGQYASYLNVFLCLKLILTGAPESCKKSLSQLIFALY